MVQRSIQDEINGDDMSNNNATTATADDDCCGNKNSDSTIYTYLTQTAV